MTVASKWTASSADSLAYSTAGELIAMLKSRQIGSEELLRLFLDRYERLNAPINAIVALDLDRAFDAARAADKALAHGDRVGALAGLPMTVKETYAAIGMRTTCGLPMLAANVSSEDAVPVGRLRAAGAVIFGKTNVPIAGADHQTDNPIYGLTRNPWALDRTVGGSSGGAAAALSAGLTPLELGSDIGGSIRIPAHMCGVFGHKSSYGLVPTRGHVPPMPGVMEEPPLAVAGPMARSARDLELALDILAARGPEKVPAAASTMQPSRHERLGDFRIALWGHDLPYAATAETREAIATLAGQLRAEGAKVSETARPGFDPQEALATYIRMLFSIILAEQPFALSPQERADLPEDAQFFASLMQDCATPDPGRWSRLERDRARLCDDWARFFGDWDAIVCPVFPSTAFEHDLSGEGLKAQLYRRRQVDDCDVVYLSQLSWPGLATLANLPSTVVPVPRQAGQLPLGLQIIGPAMDDRTTIRLAALIEERLGYVAARPPLEQTLG